MHSRDRKESAFTLLRLLYVHLLTSLFLTYNGSAADSCSNYPSTKLTCSGLTEMPVNQLNSHITHLLIERSTIPVISNDDLRKASSLYEIIMEYTNTDTIENDAFKGLNSLEYLSLKGNNINTVHSVSSLRSLHHLDLSQNPLDFSHESPFPSGVKNLETLYTSNVGMKRIVSAHLESLESLVTWRLMKNELTTLKLEDFVVLKRISSIDVEGNKIELVTPLPAKVEMKSLTFIDISNNMLRSLQENTFRGLPSLRVLHLHDNPLIVPSNSPFLSHATLEILMVSRVRANNLSGKTFVNLPQLIKIEMINSTVHKITGAFVPLRRLEDLNLQHNPLEVVEAGTFADSKSLRRLSLNGCDLKAFDPAALENVIIDGIIDVSNTELACKLKCNNLEKWAMDNGVYLEDSCRNVKPYCKSENEQCLNNEICCEDERCSKGGVCCTSGTAPTSLHFVVFLFTTFSLIFLSEY